MVINLASSAFIRYGGGLWSNTSGNNHAFTLNTTHAVGQACIANFKAPSGHYDLSILISKDTDSAIVDVELDGVVIATYDTYAAVPVDVFETINDIVLMDGDHYLKFTITGKNGASSDYVLFLGNVSFTTR